MASTTEKEEKEGNTIVSACVVQLITSKGIPLNRRFETKRHEGLKRINSNKAKKGQYKDVQKNQRKPNFAHVEKLKIYTSVLDFILLSQLIQD